MNPPKTTITILAVLSTSLALADDFKTVTGKEYKNATVSHIEADGIVLKTKSGISKVYFVELPKDVQQRFGYDATKPTATTIPSNLATAPQQGESTLEEAINKLERQNLLRLDCGRADAKAWIALAAWMSCDAQLKEKLTKNLAAYCNPKYPSIWILDKQSGRKLASYGPLQGFEAY